MISKKAARIILALLITTAIVISNKAYAGIKVPLGDEVVLKKVADLPRTDDYSIRDQEDTTRKVHMDLGCLYQTYNICWLPVYISQGPTLVGVTDGDNEHYYPLPDSVVNECLKANKLSREELTELGFFTRNGGKIAMLPIAALMVYGLIPSRKRKTEKADILQRRK